MLKKHPSFGRDVQQLIASLQENPLQGVEITAGIRKLRVAISDKNRGKSGGARVITFLAKPQEDGYELRLLYIYDKAEVGSIDRDELQTLIDCMEIELEEDK